jgi:hypothetical protein
MHGRWSAAWFLTFGASFLISCDSEVECPLSQCSDGASLILRSSEGTWAAGDYTFTITAADQIVTCTATASDDLAEGLSDPSCSVESTSDGEAHPPHATSVTDRDAAGRSYFTSTIHAAPSLMAVNVQRDGEELLSEERSLQYSDHYPHGEECGSCRVASLELMVPAD